VFGFVVDIPVTVGIFCTVFLSFWAMTVIFLQLHSLYIQPSNPSNAAFNSGSIKVHLVSLREVYINPFDLVQPSLPLFALKQPPSPLLARFPDLSVSASRSH
jgi:hypothetical protein